MANQKFRLSEFKGKTVNRKGGVNVLKCLALTKTYRLDTTYCKKLFVHIENLIKQVTGITIKYGKPAEVEFYKKKLNFEEEKILNVEEKNFILKKKLVF